MRNIEVNKIALKDKMAAFEKVCKEAGMKLTHQRLEIFRELASATDHPSAELLYKRLRKRLPTLSLDTVYRTLATIEGYGLITRIQTPESQARFEAETRQHHHFVCGQCKEIVDFLWPQFDQSSLPPPIAAMGEVRNKNVTIHGICQRCVARQK